MKRDKGGLQTRCSEKRRVTEFPFCNAPVISRYYDLCRLSNGVSCIEESSAHSKRLFTAVRVIAESCLIWAMSSFIETISVFTWAMSSFMKTIRTDGIQAFPDAAGRRGKTPKMPDSSSSERAARRASPPGAGGSRRGKGRAICRQGTSRP